MRKFIQFIATPVVVVGWVWFFLHSAFETGKELSRIFLSSVFDVDYQEEEDVE